jgi:hypothetical protein
LAAHPKTGAEGHLVFGKFKARDGLFAVEEATLALKAGAFAIILVL